MHRWADSPGVRVGKASVVSHRGLPFVRHDTGRPCALSGAGGKSLRGRRGFGLNIPLRSRYRQSGRSGTCRVKAQRKRITVHYSGNVQGVGFRYATREVATGFDVSGTVRNLPDGRVELVAEGKAQELDAFREAIRNSGVGPLIRQERVEESDARDDLRGFQILR